MDGWMMDARLRLRPPRPADAPALSALMTPEVSRWLASWPVPFTPEMAQARIAWSLDAMAAGRSLVCAVEYETAFVGWIGGGRIEGTDRGDFGYWLGEPWHGQGFMREAAPIYVAALRARLALGSIEAHLPSRQQPQRPGPRRLRPAPGRYPHALRPGPRPRRVGGCLGGRLDARSARLQS